MNDGVKGWAELTLDTPAHKFLLVTEPTVLTLRGGWVHVRVEDGAALKVVGLKDSKGESPRLRVTCVGNGAFSASDCIIRSLETPLVAVRN